MEMVPIIVLLVEAVIVLGLFGLLIYFIIQRIERKRQETFEDRDN